MRNLHAKAYLFGSKTAIVTSANLTDAGLKRNHEFGFVAGEAKIVQECQQYFDGLWRKAGSNLTLGRLTGWEDRLKRYLASGARPSPRDGLGDEGTDIVELTEPSGSTAWVEESGQAFVKFFGESDNRADRSLLIQDEVYRSGCHWACTYLRLRRPKQVKDGAIMFMGRLVKDPDDIVIYGRAVAIKHQEGRDEASPADLMKRPWKKIGQITFESIMRNLLMALYQTGYHCTP